MVLLLIIPAWILVLALVMALCVEARRSDEQEERHANAPAWDQVAESPIPVIRQSPHPGPAHQLAGDAGIAA
jgi:hypothetical protein